MGEIWEDTATTAAYVQGDELDLAFDFYLATLWLESLNAGDAAAANDQLWLSYSTVPPLQSAPFLSNHDQDRVMSQVGGDPGKARAAAALLFTAPGVPFMYYGEEVGMEGQKPDEQIRRPMQWSAEASGGLSTAEPWEALGAGWEWSNVAAETDDPASLLAHYRALIRARAGHAALRVGDLRLVATANSALYSIVRVSAEEAVLVLINLTGEPVADYALTLEESRLAAGSCTPLPILGGGTFAPLAVDPGGGFSGYVPLPEVPPYATLIVQLRPGGP